MSSNVGPSSDGKIEHSSLWAEADQRSAQVFATSGESPLLVSNLLETAGQSARTELSSAVEIIEIDHVPGEDELAVKRRSWKRVEDVVAVVADLKGSTKLNFRKNTETSAKIFEASTGNAVRIAEAFAPGYIDIQGDGLFALFSGEKAYQRGLAAAISIKTFGEYQLLDALKTHVDSATMRRVAMERAGSITPVEMPDTGYKVGMAAGLLLAKHVGTPNWHEPVWAGRPVSWAAKCAQHADAHELIVTERVYKKFENNDFITHSCDCHGEPKNLWHDTPVDGFEENSDIKFRKLRSWWCETCGDDFCAALLDGKTERESVTRDLGLAA